MQARLKSWVLERLAAGSLHLPVLPRAAHEAVQAASDGRTDASRMAEIIERDQSLSANLLRIANSPMYTQKARIVSVRQAIVRLGLAVVSEIAMLVAVKSPAFRVPGWEEELGDLFTHAFATGIFAKEIARLKRWSVEEAFLAGLLHDLGRPVLIQALLDSAKREGVDPPRSIIVALVEDLHTDVGRDLALQWKLPPAVVHAIARHHDETAAAPITMVVQLADALAENVISGAPFEAHALIERLSLYPDQVEGLLARSDAIAESVRAAA